jgi:cysteine-rich repeat protein
MGSFAWRVSIGVLLLASCKLELSNRNRGAESMSCGDAIVDPGEACDDGNVSGGDGCSADCLSDETCGNGIADQNENCDDSNGVGGDGCSADCLSDETCGNGLIDVSTGETCDDNNLIPGDGCSANCQSNEACGNTIQDVGEACDNGPGFTPTCDPDCTRPQCGDGVKNGPAGEECDDQNLTSGDGCDNQCRVEQCGNSRRESNEQCDNGTGFTAGCDPDCSFPVCGDGVRNPAAGDECDDHNTSSGDGCDRYCRVENCGNGRREDNEACDTAGETASCDGDCTPVQCNDGRVNYAAGERCEDGNTSDGDGCTGTCRWEPRVYIVGAADLLGMVNDCGGGNLYDNCSADTQTGFAWTDSTPFTPSAVDIEIDHGINCWGGYSLGADLNGSYFGELYFDTTNGCTCAPSESIVSTTISGAGYNLGGVNEVHIAPAPSCHGYALNLGLGGYARITVYP